MKKKLTGSTRLRILVLRDNIPGHFNISRGLAGILQNHCACDAVEEFELNPPRKAFARVAEWMLNRRLATEAIMRALYGQDVIREIAAREPDLIIASGGATRYALAAAHTRLGTATVFTGSPRRINPAALGLLLSPLPPSNPQTLQCLPMPSRIQPGGFPEIQSRLLAEFPDLARTPLVALILGGNGAGFTWGPDDAHRLAATLIADLKSPISPVHNARILLAHSRRTPKSFLDPLLAALAPHIALSTTTPDFPIPDVIPAFLSLASHIITTLDSATMLTECASSLKPVLAFAPQDSRPDAEFQLLTQQLLTLPNLARLDGDPALTAGTPLTPPVWPPPSPAGASNAPWLPQLAEKLRAQGLDLARFPLASP